MTATSTPVARRGGVATVDDVRLLPLAERSGRDGRLVVAESGEQVPFRIARCFIVQPGAAGVVRGQHAHKSLTQLLVSVTGRVEIEVDDARETRRFTLADPARGLLVPAGIWSRQTYLTPDASLLVLCDQPYAESDYLRDHTAFVRHVEERRRVLARRPIRLNLGCGGRPLADYINVDMDSLEQIRERYPNQSYADDLVVVNFDIFNLPFDDGTVAEVRAEALIEHLAFIDEPRFFHEVVRVLQPGGTLYVTTVDFEKAAAQWLAAPDDWKDFYRADREAVLSQHWFGTYSYHANNRWGYLTATFYGSQNGEGQFHTNAYSEGKLRAIARRLGLEVVAVERFQWQGDRDHMIAMTARKPA